MGKMASMLFGGGDKAAQQAADKSRQLQQISNDRQLSQLNENDKAAGASRAAPRGRRLFESGAGGLASTLGG